MKSGFELKSGTVFVQGTHHPLREIRKTRANSRYRDGVVLPNNSVVFILKMDDDYINKNNVYAIYYVLTSVGTGWIAVFNDEEIVVRLA